MPIPLRSPRIADGTSLDDADRPATAEELAAAIRIASDRGAHRIVIGSGRGPNARAAADRLETLWLERGGTVEDRLDWPEHAASWLRPATQLAGSRADLSLVVGTGRGWMQMMSRLLWSTDWRPSSTIVVAADGSAVSPVLVAIHGWDLAGLTGTDRGGDLWTLDRLGRPMTD